MSRVFSIKLGSLDLTAYPFMVLWDSLDHGAPENAVEVLDSFLQDGEIEVSSRSGNRTLSWTVGLEGTDLLGLATAEAALIAETDKQQNTLTITPGDGVAPSSVFETFRAAVTFVRAEAGEDANLRRYTITLRAVPTARSANEVVVAAVGTGATPAAATITSVDDCTATTGWARGADATTGPTVVTGAVTVGWSGTTSVPTQRSLSATRTGLSVNMATSPYLRVTVTQAQTGPMAASSLQFFVNGGVKYAVAKTGNDYFLDCTGMTVTSVSIIGYWLATATGAQTTTLRVDDVSRTDLLPTIGSLRQLLRNIAIVGSASAQATLAISHSTSALGDVLAYVYKNDNPSYSMPLRPYRAGGGTVSTDASMVSGANETLATPPFFDVPALSLSAGVHEMMGRFKATTTGGVQTVTVTAQTRIGGANFGPAVTTTGSATLATATYAIMSLGRLNLPPVKVPLNSSAIVRFTITATGSSVGSNITLDEAWPFNLSIGSLVRLSCGTAAPSAGGASSRVWIGPASVSNGGLPSFLRGFAADQSDATFPDVIDAWMPPRFDPPTVGLFTVTTNALNAAASASYYPRWHTNAAL